MQPRCGNADIDGIGTLSISFKVISVGEVRQIDPGTLATNAVCLRRSVRGWGALSWAGSCCMWQHVLVSWVSLGGRHDLMWTHRLIGAHTYIQSVDGWLEVARGFEMSNGLQGLQPIN